MNVSRPSFGSAFLQSFQKVGCLVIAPEAEIELQPERGKAIVRLGTAFTSEYPLDQKVRTPDGREMTLHAYALEKQAQK